MCVAIYAGGDMVSLTPRHTYNASLGLVLRALAHMRAGGALLHAAEWRMYSSALQANCICARMAAAAAVAGDSEEVCTPLKNPSLQSPSTNHRGTQCAGAINNANQ